MLDLSQTYSLEMIVGAPDQLAADNTRYIAYLNTTSSRDWIIPTVYMQDEAGNRKNITNFKSSTSTGSYTLVDGRRIPSYDLSIPGNELNETSQIYINYALNTEAFPTHQYASLKAYAGNYANAEDAMEAEDITEQLLCTDMTQPNAGYPVDLGDYGYQYSYITFVSFDAAGDVTGCMPVRLELTKSNSELLFKGIYTENDLSIWSGCSTTNDGVKNSVVTLRKGYAADASYWFKLDYNYFGNCHNELVTAAYVGQYYSISSATAAGAGDIKNELMNSGYQANYSTPVCFTVFVGNDGEEGQEIYHYSVQVQEGTTETTSLSKDTYVKFTGLKDAGGNPVPAYVVKTDEDSYGEFNYMTIMVGAHTDLTCLKPVFTMGNDGMKLYAAGSSAPEVSGESMHDFSGGAVQYTASAEDGENAKNYWLQIVKADDGAGIYVNSLADSESETRNEDGVIYANRQILMDSYHDDWHDILLINRSSTPITALKAELSSEMLELDPYWTLNGSYDLAGFTTVTSSTDYGELGNMAKLRLRVKDGIADGTSLTGTLTIKSGDKVLMVFTLTGTVGDPCMTTSEIPAAVKYVPYGTMIQNNNKYSRNKVSYELWSGTLPAGMILRPNGEIYGVPLETGEFSFYVRMNNSAGNFSNQVKRFTLTVIENTDANVDAATDAGYELSQRIQGVTPGAAQAQTVVSQGSYNEFVAVYLDGVKLTEGEDYTSESGSTRITIQGETLGSGDTDETHTIGIEFRTPDTGTLMRAAQNYTITTNDADDGNSADDGNNTDNSNNTDNGNNTSNTNNTSNANNNSNSSTSASVPAAQEYVANNITVRPADLSQGRVEGSGYYALGSTVTVKAVPNAGYRFVRWTQNGQEVSTSEVYTFIMTGEKLLTAEFAADDGSGSITDLTVSGNNGADIEIIPGETTAIYHVVAAGDSLWKIAAQYYGDGRLWTKIYEDNKDVIANPDVIYVGMRLVIYLTNNNDTASSENNVPVVPEGDMAEPEDGQAESGECIVEANDSLWKIAVREYGDGHYWRNIYEANQDIINNPKVIYRGQRLVIPTL